MWSHFSVSGAPRERRRSLRAASRYWQIVVCADVIPHTPPMSSSAGCVYRTAFFLCVCACVCVCRLFTRTIMVVLCRWTSNHALVVGCNWHKVQLQREAETLSADIYKFDN